MRRALKKKNIVKAESMYDSVRLSQFINCVMKDGKKNTACRVVYNALDQIKKEEKVENPIEIFEAAVRNVGPSMEVRSRRVGGANYQVPREVRPERRQALAMRWLLTAARAKKGSPMHVRLAGELVAASKNEGEAIRRKENTLKMAESNKAFAHFAW